MPLAPAPSALAQQTVRAAFEDLEQTVTPTDSRAFRTTTLQHVRTAALELEVQLAARQALRNMRRLGPFLDGLEHYSHVVEVLCNGTPFLSWIWAPITLILRVASEYVEAFDEIMKGYSKIAEALVRFQILGSVFSTEADFQQTLAVFYADILQFHKYAYKFVRRSGWKLLFATSWGRFQRRFDHILENLKRHGELIDHEANARNIKAASQMRHDIRAWREESLDKVEREEERQAAKEYRTILSWLKVDETEQGQIFETTSDEGTKFSGTCSWLLTNDKIKFWLQKKPESSILWVHGNPGCGKSVIAAKLVSFLQTSNPFTVYHFCTYTYPSSTKYEGILRSILQQLLRISGELVAHVYQECIVGKKPATTANLERLTEHLTTALSEEPRTLQYMWLVIDGINECEPARQTRLINLLKRLSSISPSTCGAVCKILVTTRPSRTIEKCFRRDQVVYLSDETSPLQTAIQMYVSQRLRSLHERFQQLELETEEIAEIELLISKKAGGMFLYARLVLDYVSANLFYDGDELREAINQLPETLAEFYHKLLAQILSRLTEQSQDRVRCIFSWIAFAKRPLKKLEFLSALSFTSGNPKLTKLVPRYIVEDVCSPLIEERRDTSLTFIHVSVKHFLQSSVSAMVLEEKDALREHGTAAVSCLLSGLQVFDKLHDEQTRLLRLVKGVHGFHVYATEYWVEYLLANAAMSGGLEGSQKLMDLTKGLAEALDVISVVPPPKRRKSSGSVDDRLSLLKRYGTIHLHVEKAMFARSQERLESELLQDSPAHGEDSSRMSDYLDGVSVTLNAYQKAVETLLDQDSCPGASVEELELFKSQFRTSAYTCRLRSCPRATVGFRSDQLRREHELAHSGGFRCTFQGCQYPPLRTSKVLKAHVDSVHCHLVALPRKSIRRVGRLKLSDKDTSVKATKNKDGRTFNRSKRDKTIPGNLSDSASPTSRDSMEPSTSGSVCWECSRRSVQCDKVRPTCSTCKRWSRICTYLDPTIDSEQLASESEQSAMFSQTAQTFGSDLLGSSSMGIGYLDILLDKLGKSVLIDSSLYEEIKAILADDFHAHCKLSELVDNATAGSTDDLTPDDVITPLWSGYPELAQKLRRLCDGDREHQDVMELVTGDEQIECESDDEATLCEPLRYCFCDKENSGTLIPCDNAQCPRKWFHLHCVNLVVTPYQEEQWFCSDGCRAAGSTVTIE